MVIICYDEKPTGECSQAQGFTDVHNHQSRKAVMRKLILTNDPNAPIDAVIRILENWGKLASDVEAYAPLRDGFYLEWRVGMATNPSSPGGWLGICSVGMGILANTRITSNGLDTTKTFVPLTVASWITIFATGYDWHGVSYRDMIEQISTALRKGELPTGHHFEANGFSRKILGRE